jgi:hypothetical protein
MLNVAMLSVIMLNVAMLSVVAPWQHIETILFDSKMPEKYKAPLLLLLAFSRRLDSNRSSQDQ